MFLLLHSMDKLQKNPDRLGEWATENATKINPSKTKAIRFTRARAEDTLNYSLTFRNLASYIYDGRKITL